MKKLLIVPILALILATGGGFDSTYAGDAQPGDSIPLSRLAGKWAQSSQGSFTICFKPDFSATESCSASESVPVTGNFVLVSHNTQDADGDQCSDQTLTIGLFPKLPPFVSTGHSVTKITKYDPVTGSGDDSYVDYQGGKCIGSKFDSTGATITSSGTDHFVASQNGERLDFVTTTATDPLGDTGAFNSPIVALKQNSR